MITEERLDELAIQVSFRSDVDALNIFKLIEEIRRLNKIIAKEVGDKFELGAAYNAFKEENKRLHTFIFDVAPSWLPIELRNRRREILGIKE